MLWPLPWKLVAVPDHPLSEEPLPDNQHESSLLQLHWIIEPNSWLHTGQHELNHLARCPNTWTPKGLGPSHDHFPGHRSYCVCPYFPCKVTWCWILGSFLLSAMAGWPSENSENKERSRPSSTCTSLTPVACCSIITSLALCSHLHLGFGKKIHKSLNWVC